MPTNDNTPITDTNEAEVKPLPPRGINVLLNLGTFQGMTDEEIQLVIDYKIKNALSNEKIKLEQAVYIEQMNSEIALRTQAVDEANAIYKEILGKTLKLETVGISNE